MSISKRVRVAIGGQMGMEPNMEDFDWMEDFGADSLDEAEIIMAMEEEFEIDIDDHEWDEIKNVGQLVDFIERNV